MQTLSEISKTLERDKKHLIIERYLREKYKERFNPLWLNAMDNYTNLGAAIDFFYQLNHDKLNLSAIGSDNHLTQEDYAEQFKSLVSLLDKVVIFTGDNPPVATKFNEKDATLLGLELNQNMDGRSLRDLHAQSSNLGIAEKLLNEELGQTEWLGEVDLERMLIKLGVKDRTHITRLNAEDIGMILHFERVKNANAVAPYHIPLLLNCGSSGSIRSQGAHWTYAMVTVDPTTNSITINYHDSMPLRGGERAVLEAAIDYVDGAYSAFPGYTKVVTPVSDGLQEDNWSCGYRALKGLISDPNFPTHGGVAAGNDWIRLANTNMESYALRDSFYQTLLSDLAIDEDYFMAMDLDSDMLKKSSGGYEVDGEFTKRYLELVTQTKKKNELITTNHFEKELNEIVKQASTGIAEVVTDRVDSVQRLIKGVQSVTKNDSLSSDAKIIAILDVLSKEYATILRTRGGSGSKLGKFIKSFCEAHFGVELDKDEKYRLKSNGLMMRILTDQTAITKKVEEESLLPPLTVKKVTPEPNKVSQSAPIVQRTTSIKPQVSPSVDTIRTEGIDLGQKKLRTNKQLSRLGTMFGDQQFCYAEKPGGVEPGFRAIDLDEHFFTELNKILSDEQLSSLDTKLSPGDKKEYGKLRDLLNSKDLQGKQRIFATFINTNVRAPHEPGDLSPKVAWLAKEVKGAVDGNKKLNAWMYKLDYAEGGKNRLDANKEALREYVGTYLARVFSEQNQKQEVAWVKGKKGFHAVLACGWKQGLQPLKGFLYGGSEPDYNGILVEDVNAPVKYSKHIRGAGKNLILGIGIGDRDGMGKEAQNKGLADGEFYGFDYGKTYEGEGVCQSIKDDFTFEDSYASYPAIFRGSSLIGVARHYMYRNFSVFYDTDLSERMFGLHLMRKMITGENPSEDIIKSYPGLRHELNRIQEVTPSPKELLNQLSNIRSNCKDGSPEQRLIDTYMMQISTGKLSHFERYFAQIKIGIINDAVQNNMPYSDIEEYMAFIDGMAVTAAKNNQAILNTFEQRALLTKQEIDLIDRMEKIYSPTTAMSHEGTVFLNTLRIEPSSARIPFQLKRELDGTYTLSTTDPTINLKKEFGIKCIQNEKGSSCNLTPQELVILMQRAETKYNEKREALLMKPTYYYETLPRVESLINKDNSSNTLNVDLRYAWLSDGRLSLRVVPKTEEQAQIIQELFELDELPKVNVVNIIEVPSEEIKEFKNMVHETYANMLRLQLKGKTTGEQNVKSSSSEVGVELMPISKWGKFHKESQETISSTTVLPLVKQEAQKLIKRYEGLVSGKTLADVTDAIAEISDIKIIQKLLTYNDKTLSSVENINAIIEEKVDNIKIVEDELVISSSTSNPTDVVTLSNNLNTSL